MDTITEPLADIAAQINGMHVRANAQAREALATAKACGELLIRAKAEVKHGDWLPWIAANLSFGPRQAQKYIKLARYWDELEAKSNSHFSLDEALSLLTSPRKSTLEILKESAPSTSWMHRIEELGLTSTQGMWLLAGDGDVFVEPAAIHDRLGQLFHVMKLVGSPHHTVEHFGRPVTLAGVAAALDHFGAQDQPRHPIKDEGFCRIFLVDDIQPAPSAMVNLDLCAGAVQQ